MTRNKGPCATVLAKATSPPTEYIQQMRVIDLTIDGNPTDISEFSAAACSSTFTKQENTIKSLSLSLEGDEDVSTGIQALVWANMVSGADLFIKVGFGAAGAGPTFLFQANVNNVNFNANAAGGEFQTVKFDISNKGDVTIA